MKRMFAAAAVLVLLGLYGAGGVLAQTANSFSPHVDGAGRISLPEDFRSWAYLGSWAIYGGEDGATGFHNVYTQPETVAAFARPESSRTARSWSRSCWARRPAT